jgi:DAK2 domain fusion protein YloV
MQTPEMAVQTQIANEEFGYCTEFVLKIGGNDKKQFASKRFTAFLETNGNSLVVIQDEDLVKVHIHTLFPGHVLSYAQRFGEFKTLKIENMQEQHSHIIDDNHQHIKLSKAKKYGIITVSVGDGLNEMFNALNIDKIVSGGQSMNPATSDFINAINEINADNIFILPNNSNIILTAEQVVDLVTDKRIIVIPSTTIPQGLMASMMFNPETDVEANIEEMNNAIKRVKSGQVTLAVRDTQINGVEVHANQYIGITGKNIIASETEISSASLKLLNSMIDEDSIIVSIYYGEGVSQEDAEKLAEEVKRLYPPIDVEIYAGNQPIYSFIFGIE